MIHSEERKKIWFLFDRINQVVLPHSLKTFCSLLESRNLLIKKLCSNYDKYNILSQLDFLSRMSPTPYSSYHHKEHL